MPRRESQNVQTSQNSKTWWIWLIIGVMILFVPGGVFISPVMFLIAIIMKRRNKSKESPETPSLLFQFTP
jgi:heme/copper-type cytochrome/quinol oxidase subunit 2